METEIRRGDVYWLQSDDLGIEQKLGRPIVVVSSNKGNEVAQQVIGLFCTTARKWGVINVEIKTPRKWSWVQCNYPITAYKERLGNYIYTLTDDEMAAVEKGMRVAMGLGSDSSDFEDERREFEEEIASLKSQIAAKKDRSVEVIVERDMYKRMYEKAVEMLAGSKMPEVEAEAPKVSTPKITVAKEESRVEEESLVEINSCSEKDLRDVGCTLTMIHNIVANRPYKSVEDLRRVPSITNVAYRILSNKVCCVPVVKEKKIVSTEKLNVKVNVNTATVAELKEVLGLSNSTAQQIVSHRKKFGNFSKLEDLMACSRFGATCLKKYGPRMEV